MEQVKKPYVKKYDSNGNILNPLPYYHNLTSSTRQIRRGNHRIVFSSITNSFVIERRVKSQSNKRWVKTF